MTAFKLVQSGATNLQALRAGLSELAAGATPAWLAGLLLHPSCCRSAAVALGTQQLGPRDCLKPLPECSSAQHQQLTSWLLQQVQQQQQQLRSSLADSSRRRWAHSMLAAHGSDFGLGLQPLQITCAVMHNHAAAPGVYLQHSGNFVGGVASGIGSRCLPQLSRPSRHASICSRGSSMLWLGPGRHRPFSSLVGRCSKSGYVLDYVHTQHPQACQQTPTPAAAAQVQAVANGITTAAIAAAAAAAGGPGAAPRGRVVAVAVSGGVDSAVSALLLQQQGYQIFGVYMHNWDTADEAGAGTPICTSAADLADAQALCKSLNIPLYEADFVSRYWNEVFETFLQGLSQGLTPNPDLACNSHIKFGALLQFAREQGADLLATGHYARLGWQATAEGDDTAAEAGRAGEGGKKAAAAAAAAAVPAAWQPVLLAGSDPAKDQSYFLASLTQQQLAQAMFPVGHMTKAQVREIAAAAGLSQATKRSSAGICFIGRRSFGKFLEAYLQPRPGLYVDADSAAVLGPCSNMLAVTVGQKALGLGGQKTRVYVAGKDLVRGVVHVVAGHEHPALYSRRVLLRAPNWVSGQPPAQLRPLGASYMDSSSEHVLAGGSVVSAAATAAPAGGHGICVTGTVQLVGVLHCQYQARYRQPAADCSIRVLTAADAAAFKVSKFCSAGSVGCGVDSGASNTANEADKKAVSALEQAGRLVEGHSMQGPNSCDQFLVAELAVPLRGIALGQMFVLYGGEVCLGSATIVAHGPTLAEQQDGDLVSYSYT